MDACPFCGIVEGEVDAHVVHEDEETVAFLDRNPAAPGHTLVAPRAHRHHLFDGDEDATMAVFRTLTEVTEALYGALGPDGVSVFYTSAELVGHVRHAHVHLIPRYEDDGVHLSLDRQSLGEREGTELADRIREAL